ncbi:hypothetical protein ES703_10101 [subsurface metagenome]
MDKDKLSKYRADVIESFINIETIINAIICQRYFKKVIKDFYFEVLYDEYFTFGLKRRILEKIIKELDSQKLQDLNRLNTIRNYFAHYNQEFFEASDKEKKEGKVIDPRNIKSEIDFERLYDEFKSKQTGVEKYLSELHQSLGGEFFKE